MTRSDARWVLLPFEVLLGFIAVGISAAMIASVFHLWFEPVAGFFAATAVVAVAYLRAPARRLAAAFVAYLIGCVAARQLLWQNGFYPEDYASAYAPTNLPFWVTLAGGTLALVIAILHALAKRRTPSNTSLERTREA